MIKSILDQDLYTLTVGQAVLETYPESIAEFQFKNRRDYLFPTGDHDAAFLKLFQEQLDKMRELRLTESELSFLQGNTPFLKKAYLDYLWNYRFDPTEVEPSMNNGILSLKIKGPWHRTLFWEVPTLALISECYYSVLGLIPTDYQDQIDRIAVKSQILKDGQAHYADFGTRRRRCYDIQDLVVREMRSNPFFVGTSNVHLAHKYQTKPIGTMSHQWIMGCSALESLRHANRYALYQWNNVYKGDLGIALPDTFGMDAFFADFDKQLARMFDGVRHDSGDPFEFADLVVAHYRKLKIDPWTKTIVFSDSLDSTKAVALREYCTRIGIRASFGIGTNFTNEFPESAALNIVIKLRNIAANAGSPPVEVVKLSSVPTKATGDADALAVAMWTFFNKPLNRKE